MSSSSNNLAKNAAIGKKPVNRASERDQVDPREGPSKESGSSGSSDARFVVDNRKGKDRSRSRSSDRRSASPRRSSTRAALPSRDGNALNKRARRSRSPSRARRSRTRSGDRRPRGSPQSNKSVDISQQVGCLEHTVQQQREHLQRQDQRFDRIEQLLTQWSAPG